MRSDDALRFARRIEVTEPWFEFELASGNRDETARFEARFRKFGPEFVEAWYEVIYWKLASTRRLGESRAERIIRDLRGFKPIAPEMWAACSEFAENGSRKLFERLQAALFIVSGGIPMAATFPAFMRPDRFSMVDRQIAKWVLRYRQAHPANFQSEDLVAPSESFVHGRKTTLTVSGDWNFYSSWIDWCQASARILSDRTGFEWRARDVEMAAFNNAMSRSPLLPAIGR